MNILFFSHIITLMLVGNQNISILENCHDQFIGLPVFEFEDESFKVCSIKNIDQQPTSNEAVREMREFKSNMDAIASMMSDNPAMIIQIGVHEDIRGSVNGDIKSSEIKAKIIQKYLTNLGTDTLRFSVRGYGSKYPINSSEKISNSDLSNRADLHDANSRYSIKILSI